MRVRSHETLRLSSPQSRCPRPALHNRHKAFEEGWRQQSCTPAVRQRRRRPTQFPLEPTENQAPWDTDPCDAAILPAQLKNTRKHVLVKSVCRHGHALGPCLGRPGANRRSKKSALGAEISASRQEAAVWRTFAEDRGEGRNRDASHQSFHVAVPLLGYPVHLVPSVEPPRRCDRLLGACGIAGGRDGGRLADPIGPAHFEQSQRAPSWLLARIWCILPSSGVGASVPEERPAGTRTQRQVSAMPAKRS
jgi:hypothetical protein